MWCLGTDLAPTLDDFGSIKPKKTIQPQSANIKPCGCDITSLQTCEYLHETLRALLVHEIKFINAKQLRQVLLI